MVKTVMLNSDIDISLRREASMSSMAIGMGLTQIRKYDFKQNGYFYSGLLSYTSGIERLLKLILIYDYRLNNGGIFPNNSYLKSLGHKLNDLIDKAKKINVAHSLGLNDNFLDQDNIYKLIISLLTDYAVQARYYNLDYLTGIQQAGIEPLFRWDKEVCTEILKRHYKPKQEKLDLLNQLAEEIEESVYVKFIQEDGSEINNLKSLILQESQVPIKQKFSMYYLYTIARFFSKQCAELEFKGNYFPCLREFFMIYMNEDKKYILGRKMWNPLLP